MQVGIAGDIINLVKRPIQLFNQSPLSRTVGTSDQKGVSQSAELVGTNQVFDSFSS
jgi:hypothetical protein